MKKIISALIAASVTAASVVPVSVCARDVKGMDCCYMTSINNEGMTYYQFGKLDRDAVLPIGYIYITEDGYTPSASQALSPMTREDSLDDEACYPYSVEEYVPKLITDKYNSVYCSEKLITDRTGIVKIVEVSSCIVRLYRFVNDRVGVVLDYTLDEFIANKEAILGEIQEKLPEGYELSLYEELKETEYDNRSCTAISLTAVNEAVFFGETFVVLNDVLSSIDSVLKTSITGYGTSGTVYEDVNLWSYAYSPQQLTYDMVYSSIGFEGDSNNDGLLEISDVQTLLKHTANSAAGITDPIVAAVPDNMDVNGNGEVSIQDAQYLLTYCAQQAAGMNPTWDSIING